MTHTNLSSETAKRLDFLFTVQDREKAISILSNECSQNLPFLDASTAEGLERFHFAALKLSRGNLDRLREAVELAKQDWRDLLVAAGFANSTEAHLHWQPRKQSRKYEAEPSHPANPRNAGG